ncbi:MAG: hypothetical protein IJ568_00030 [Bacilli bacterium]|nr:hypothetical protein [Bacilli bacterium]
MLETELSQKLRIFFKRVENMYGDEIAFATTVEENDIAASLNKNSNNEFKKYNSTQVLKELLKNEVLCNDQENIMVKITKELIMKDSIEEIERIFDSVDSFKSILIHSYIDNARISYEEKFAKTTDTNTNDYLKKIASYKTDNNIYQKRNFL